MSAACCKRVVLTSLWGPIFLLWTLHYCESFIRWLVIPLQLFLLPRCFSTVSHPPSFLFFFFFNSGSTLSSVHLQHTDIKIHSTTGSHSNYFFFLQHFRSTDLKAPLLSPTPDQSHILKAQTQLYPISLLQFSSHWQRCTPKTLKAELGKDSERKTFSCNVNHDMMTWWKHSFTIFDALLYFCFLFWRFPM